jgi:hypothetical protein
MWMLLWALAGCTLEDIGAVGCDEWCDTLMNRAEQCAAEEGISVEQFAGQPPAEVEAACQDEAATRTEEQCNIETATATNATCDQIANLVAELAG